MSSIKFYIGLLIALPMMCIFTYILMMADEVFANFVKEIITNIGDFVKTVLRLENIRDLFVIIGFVIVSIIGLSSYMLSKVNFKIKDIGLKATTEDKGYEMYIINIVIGGLNMVFLVFVLFQLRLIFSADSYLADTGITYASFARRGFFELQFVMFGVALILYFVQMFRKATAKASSLFTSANLSLMGVFSLIMGASTLFRLDMYYDAYGLTLKRLFSSTFTIFEILLIGTLLLAIFKRELLKYVSGISFMFLVLLITILSIASPERMVASSNIHRANVTRQPLDYSYLINQSSDGYGRILDKSFLQPEVKCMFARKYLQIKKHDASWHEFSISGNNNYKKLEELIVSEENAKNLIKDCNDRTDSKIKIDLENYEALVNSGEYQKAYSEYWDRNNSKMVDLADLDLESKWKIEFKSLSSDQYLNKHIDETFIDGVDTIVHGIAFFDAIYEDEEKTVTCKDNVNYTSKNGETLINYASIFRLGVYSYDSGMGDSYDYAQEEINNIRNQLKNPLGNQYQYLECTTETKSNEVDSNSLLRF